jgi:hypothetical protein
MYVAMRADDAIVAAWHAVWRAVADGFVAHGMTHCPPHEHHKVTSDEDRYNAGCDDIERHINSIRMRHDITRF